MKTFGYADNEIGMKELWFSIISYTMSVGVLVYPRTVASATEASDGWLSITIAGVFFLFAWITAKLVSIFPKKTFYDYTTTIATKPVAIILTFISAIGFLIIVSFQVRAIGQIAMNYFFDRTPIEFVSLAFLLVVVYGVQGSRVGLIRLNLMFLPFILVVILLVLLFNIGLFEMGNLKPFFTTKWTDVLKGSTEMALPFGGYILVLFYGFMLKRPKEAPKGSLIALVIVLIIYILLFTIVIGVLGSTTTMNISYPTIEIAKEIQAPGGFFERFESIFFVIWVMTIFTTAAISHDISIMAFGWLFPKVKKMTWIYISTPLIYIIAMFPQNQLEVAQMGKWIGYFIIYLGVVTPSLLIIIAKLRRLKG